MNVIHKHINWFIGIAMAVLTVALGYFTQQHEFSKIICFYAPLFILYLFAYSFSPTTSHESPITFYLALAILLRLILLFSIPNLSNDVYRFIWDGRLLVQGHNPFDHLPLYYLETQHQIPGIDRALFEAFGAKNTFSVYPPLAQLQFGSACWLFPQNIYGAVVVMKLWLFAFEAGTIFLIIQLLKHFQLPARNVLLYALNPLIILEITGNLHFEGAMIFFLLLALWLLIKWDGSGRMRWFIGSAVAFALSVSSKLLTLLFLPFFIKTIGWRRSISYFMLTGIATGLLFMPVVNATFFANFGDSLYLYFQKLEFNASLYYLLRWLFFQIYGYNQIAILGPALGLLAFGGIIWMAFKTPAVKVGENEAWTLLIRRWLFAISLYLLCTTTLHPWYLALPILFCVFTPYRYPIIWSGVIFLTYINYSYQPYEENLWVVAAEYLTVLLWLFWEWRTIRQKRVSL